MQRNLLIAFSLVSLSAALLYWHYSALEQTEPVTLSQPALPSSQPAQDDTLKVQRNNQRLQNTPAPALPHPGPLPASLVGTSQDVRLLTDRNGHFQPTSDSLGLFEFYLAGVEEEPIEKVLQRIHWDLANQLEEPALGEARDLLKRYLDYRIALMDLPQVASTDTHALEQRLNNMSQLRQRYFNSNEYALFFADDEREDRRMLAQLANPAASAQIEQSFAQQLTPEQRESRAQITRDGELYAQVEQRLAEGATAEEIYALREQTLGNQAATALAELDQQRAAWQRRLDAYANERQRILSSGLAPADQQQAISQLLAQRFEPNEQVRAQALTE